jgi:hypothetical protein
LLRLPGGPKPAGAPHGFRSTFRTWGQNETSIEREVLEYCLHHIEDGEAELAYARGDIWEKRKAALSAWGTFCNPEAAPKIKPRRRLLAPFANTRRRICGP